MSAQPKSATRTIEKTVEINAPLEAVWKALAVADELARWFPLEARVEPRVGGADSLLWLSNEGSGEKTEVGFWLSAYNISPAEVAAFESPWKAALEELFP